MKHLYLILVSLFVSLACFAQVTLTGRVINQADTKPVADASVFISNATIGDKTSVDGKFSLNNLKPGKYELVVSLVGFEAYKQNITVEDKNISLPDITVYPKTITLNEVKIKVKKDPDRKRNYEWFRDEFLGKSELAKETRILNPEMLDLEYDERNGVLKGSSADFLVIENHALGYRMKYLLSDFMLNNYDEQNKSFSYAGSVFFEKLKGTADEEQQWKSRRQEVYEGSQLHFLRSALNDKLEQEGFRVLRVTITRNGQRPADSVIDENIRIYNVLLKNEKGRNSYKDSLVYWIKKSKLPVIQQQKLLPTPLTKNEIINKNKKGGLYRLGTGNNDGLLVIYNKYGHFSTGAYSHLSDVNNTSTTLLTFNEPAALFDNNGAINNPRSLNYEGAWGRARVAALLPVDYEPTENNAQTDTALANSISAKINSYIVKHPTEKAYLHLDKPYYAAGDTIYFKAYVTRDEENKLWGLSGVLSADLIDPGNRVVRSIKLQLTDGVAWGDFALADSLKQGDYRVRAYTRLMQREGSFFCQSIAVGSSLPGRVSEGGGGQLIAKGSPETKFLPEGGTLVTGVKSKIAFKATGANGQGIAVKGTIVDNENKEITAFASAHLGMGYFYLAPAENKTYRAKLIYADGTQAETELPKSESRGISMEVTDEPRLYTIKISSSKTYYQEHKNKTYTLITCSGTAVSGISHKLDNPKVTLILYKKELHTGIARTTLFTDNGEPLCERLLFVQNDDPKPQISSDKTIYNKREKVTLTLHAAQGHYSAAVTDENKLTTDENNEPTIINNLLLTSELRGNIEQPNYYFNNINEKTAADLDLVMLTHGYRKFEWKKILNSGSTETPADQPEKGLTIAGTVKAHGKPVVSGRVNLFSKTGAGLMLDTTTDKNGHFVFDNLTFSDSTKFVIQARTAKGERDVDVEMDKAPAAPILTMVTDMTTNNNSLSAYMQSSKLFKEEQKKYGVNQHQTLLKEVIIKDKRKDPLLSHSENLNGAGNADQVITSKWLENSGYGTLYNALRAKANFVEFNILHQVISKHTGTQLNGAQDLMEIIVDGTPMLQPGRFGERSPLEELHTDEVESVEIGLGPHYGAIYGSRASGGVIIITTKRAKKINNYYREAPGVIVYTAPGFYKAREFYSPQYDNPKTNQKMPDLRSTIFWKPDITTDADGKAAFSFFNADGKGTYRVVIEGIDADGKLGRQVYRYRVE